MLLENVALDRPRGCFKPCMWCDSDKATLDTDIINNTLKHAAKVVCNSCGRQIAWAGQRDVKRAIRKVEGN